MTRLHQALGVLISLALSSAAAIAAETVVRDHRTEPVIRDHRSQPVIRDHRSQPVIRDHRTQPIVRDHRVVQPVLIPG